MKLKNLILPVISALLVAGSVSAYTVIVKSGDTLSQIAKDNGTTYQQIAADNNIANPDLIFPGQVFNIGGQLGSAPMRPSGIDIKIRQSLVAGASRTGSTLNIDPIITPDGHRWTMAEIGTIAFGKIDQGTSNEEIISWSSSTDYTTYYQLGGVNWGYDYTGLTTSTSNYKRHNSGARFIITDDDQYLQSVYMNLGYTQTVTGAKTFNIFPVVSSSTALPSSNGQFATKYYVDTVGAGGFTSVNVSTTRGLSVDGSSPEKVGINASTTLGGAFDDNGAYYQKTTTGLSNGSNGIGIDYANNNTWSGTNNLISTTTLGNTVFNSPTYGNYKNSIKLVAGETLTKGQAVVFVGSSTDATSTLVSITGTDNSLIFSPTTVWGSQTFMTTAYGTKIPSVLVYFSPPSSPNSCSVVVSLRATSAGLPTGDDLFTSDTESLVWNEQSKLFTLNATTTSSTLYAIIVRSTGCTGGSSGVRYMSNQYTGGNMAQSANSGSTWTDNATYDLSMTITQVETFDGGVYRSNATTDNVFANAFIGFANENIATSTLGYIDVSGVSDSLSGLLLGSTYYLSDTPGAIQTSSGSQSRKIGFPISPTQFLIKHDNP